MLKVFLFLFTSLSLSLSLPLSLPSLSFSPSTSYPLEIEVVTGASSHHRTVPILGIHQTPNTTAGRITMAAGQVPADHLTSGRIAVYGDSNCIDSAHLQSGK